jgi:hypothetical protein
LIFGTQIYQVEEFADTPWILSTPIYVQGKTVGKLDVCYVKERPQGDDGPFLKQERSLIENIAAQFGMFVLHRQLKAVFEGTDETTSREKSEWEKILDLIRKTDPSLTVRITRKMINYLCLRGIKEAIDLFVDYAANKELLKDSNAPFHVEEAPEAGLSTSEIFALAQKHLSEEEMFTYLRTWINEDNSGFMVNIFENTGSTLKDLRAAIERYYYLANQGLELSPLREKGFRVALIRRLFTDQPSLIDIAKQYIDIKSFYPLIQRVIAPPGSHGKLGGKSSGLFIAKKILEAASKKKPFLKQVKTPKTWYITSDGILNFIKHNNLEDAYEQKYKDIGIIRQEYPHLVRIFKKSPFSPEMVRQLSAALDDFGDVPLVVRSSSLLEDRMGTAFAGKYKSLFIANQGSKEKRLMALMDAIAEIYASTFGPDPIEYRTERQLLDYHEEMGIMIQEVIGTRVGDYFFPAFAGVAFSHNEFRWSSRLRRKDGLIRMVPGLGTRAVDRVNDDYPVLVAPGQPNLRVNASPDELLRYSPKKIDLINLKTRKFETHDLDEVISRFGQEYPRIHQIVSLINGNYLKTPRVFGVDYQREQTIVTFNGLIGKTPFIQEMHTILKLLEKSYQTPVDMEFAHDGEHFYLLQCRPQSHGDDLEAVALPSGIPNDRILFSANKYIANALVKDITHIVYVDPAAYAQLGSREEMLEVGRAVGHLNKVLPKRRFILMGPGRWGSKGDIKLGVSVTYSQINRTAMLIEIARKKKDYVPDVSFGTHFFLDLVEAQIRYLPLYPDDDGVIFNDGLFQTLPNAFPTLCPEQAELASVIKVINLNQYHTGQVLNIYMSAEARKALAVFSESTGIAPMAAPKAYPPASAMAPKATDLHWQWRLRFIQHLASMLDPEQFGVSKLCVHGSTMDGTATPESDIDIAVYFYGSELQRLLLTQWLEGWSQALSFLNFIKTGVHTAGLLDVHWVDESRVAGVPPSTKPVFPDCKQLVLGSNLDAPKAR